MHTQEGPPWPGAGCWLAACPALRKAPWRAAGQKPASHKPRPPLSLRGPRQSPEESSRGNQPSCHRQLNSNPFNCQDGTHRPEAWSWRLCGPSTPLTCELWAPVSGDRLPLTYFPLVTDQEVASSGRGGFTSRGRDPCPLVAGGLGTGAMPALCLPRDPGNLDKRACQGSGPAVCVPQPRPRIHWSLDPTKGGMGRGIYGA